LDIHYVSDVEIMGSEHHTASEQHYIWDQQHSNSTTEHQTAFEQHYTCCRDELKEEEHPDGFHLVKGNAVGLTPQKYLKTICV
jgi:hypothetical protein